MSRRASAACGLLAVVLAEFDCGARWHGVFGNTRKNLHRSRIPHLPGMAAGEFEEMAGGKVGAMSFAAGSKR